MNNKILVVFGGNSVEHEISIISALQMINAYKGKYELVPIYLKDSSFYQCKKLNDISFYKDLDINTLKHHKITFFANSTYYKKHFKRYDFLAIWLISHGKDCEDGTITGYFKTLNIPLIAEDILSASIGQNKVISKKLVSVDTLPYFEVLKNDIANDLEGIITKALNIGFPLICKPNNLGSSVGVVKVNSSSELINAFELIFSFDDSLIVEKCLNDFIEYNLALVNYNNNIYYSQIEQVSKGHILTYNDKYVNSSKSLAGNNKIISPNLSSTLTHKIVESGKTIYKELKAKYITRIDFLYDSTNDILYFNEINNIPGSLAYYLFEPSNLNIIKLVNMVIDEGLKDINSKKQIINNYSQNIILLSDFNNIKMSK